ncbi:Transcriptional regulator [Friedmanniomyces endolithicus]|uniref:Transcriptional regulator n=2 Tax=Dothideomycetidae TaxID=451867 RepID=A0AAN6QQJ0_9PEZI|nr:Transcriptional regulator [Friedmanniomyces endolithicus]KAK0781612.1 Transcriptional regulator [Friedmanniomyces endolithicus]KAK0786519.1 Transcriptional regulator [Friedmanniomyces endolithicus]KAK0810403.1 Transcriptional regulator [Friedmanniomyces endolithicus]KAK0848469.1 Transcriptional regulator [Friedmanniomyces endolithicus]
MPPTSKKTAAAKASKPSSRHSTPLTETASTAPPTPLMGTPTPATPVPKETAYLRTPTITLVSSDSSIEQLTTGTTAKANDPPSARELFRLYNTIRDSIRTIIAKRGETCDRSMRQLVQKRKERLQAEREAEAEREAHELVMKQEQEDSERRKVKKEKVLSKKRSRDEVEVDAEEEQARRRESLPSTGAHGLARQDGLNVHQGTPPPASPPVPSGTAVIDPMDITASPTDSEDARAEPPSIIPLYERAFGQDPTKFDDPTVYDIREVTTDMTHDEKREIFNVLYWPETDLSDLTAGEPPDKDFSNNKPSNQTNFFTFQTYVEPYIRPFTEEDVTFLKERGDRVTPYLIPNRGAKSYKDVWAAEDGLTGIEPPAKLELNPNEPRGSMEEMDDATAETDEVSLGPSAERLQALLRAAPNPVTKKDDSNDVDANGDTSMFNADDDPATQPGAADDHHAFRPATYLPPDAPRPANLPTLDYGTMEQRALQELRYIGFLGPTETPDYAAHNDDEVAARLRTLQHELRRVSRANNIRKARILELTEERMAMQEYSNIADDLDNQVNAAYLKRNRSLSAKPPKKGASAAAQAARKGVGVATGAAGGRIVSEGVRALMQKRKDWIDMVGPVVGHGRPKILKDTETVFDEESLRVWGRVEMEAEAGDGGLEGE